jgi:6-phosphogluconolactonase
MTPAPDVRVEPDADQLAAAVAGALVDRLAAAQSAHGTASVVLTGGGIGIAVLEQVAALTGERIDWTAVDVWWGDERFVPAGDDERNEKAARRALLDVVGVPENHVHAMPPSDGEFAEPEDAAAWYAGELAAAAPPGAELPRFDVLLLGIGPEGHTASIFPHSPAAHDQRAAFAVRDCPKPPPTRVSLGFSAINAADEVWLVISGEAKAPAVARALAGADRVELPAAGVHGTRATRWWLDRGAAGRPPGAGT